MSQVYSTGSQFQQTHSGGNGQQSGAGGGAGAGGSQFQQTHSGGNGQQYGAGGGAGAGAGGSAGGYQAAVGSVAAAGNPGNGRPYGYAAGGTLHPLNSPGGQIKGISGSPSGIIIEFEEAPTLRETYQPETHLSPQQARRDVEGYLAQLQALPPGTMVLPLPLVAARDAIEQCKAMLYDMDQAGIYSSQGRS